MKQRSLIEAALADTSRDEERLRFVEVDAADGAVVFVESVDEGSHPVIPELDYAAMEAGQDPWPLAVEAQPFYPITLRLEFRQHCRFLSLSPPIDRSISQNTNRERERERENCIKENDD